MRDNTQKQKKKEDFDTISTMPSPSPGQIFLDKGKREPTCQNNQGAEDYHEPTRTINKFYNFCFSCGSWLDSRVMLLPG